MLLAFFCYSKHVCKHVNKPKLFNLKKSLTVNQSQRFGWVSCRFSHLVHCFGSSKVLLYLLASPSKKKNVSLTVVPIRKLWSYSNAKFMSCTLNMVLSALLKYFFNTPCFQVYRYSFYYLLVSVSESVPTSQSASNSQSQSASISPSVSASVSVESTMILNQLVRKSSILFSSRYILVFQSWPFV